MKILVQKFGGSSVADLECMKKVRTKVMGALEQGYKVVVVLSARHGQTNKLVEMAYQWSDEPDLAEYDSLLSTGEQESAALFTMLIKDLGVKARSILGFQIPIITDDCHSMARIISIDSANILKEFEKFDVIVMAGFQGVTAGGRITTLGRGGSDTSAVAIAAALGSCPCHIYTDVDGVYTTDPRMVPQARQIPKIYYEEMLEMASMGAKVLQIRSVEFAKKYNVPVWVLSTFNNNPGTLVTQEEEDSMMELYMVSGIAFDKDQVRITLLGIPDKPGISAALFVPLAEQEILVDMIIQKASRDGITDMTYTVSHRDFKRAMAATEKVCQEIGGEGVEFDDKVAKVSVIGVGMRNHSGVAASAFTALHEANININMISTSEIKISCLIFEDDLEKAVKVLHNTFALDQER